MGIRAAQRASQHILVTRQGSLTAKDAKREGCEGCEGCAESATGVALDELWAVSATGSGGSAGAPPGLAGGGKSDRIGRYVPRDLREQHFGHNPRVDGVRSKVG